MNLYAAKSTSVFQKLTITLFEILLIGFSAWIMFGQGQFLAANIFHFNALQSIPTRRWVILAFSIIVLLRMALMMVRFLKRRIPWSETLAVPGAFAIYYVGFAILCLPSSEPFGVSDYIGVGLFAIGSWLNTWSEFQRDIFKRKAVNKGKIYTKGLFSTSMHINYFGDVLWVFAYAILAQNIWGYFIPALLFVFFAFYNIPMLDAYLAKKYGTDFQDYAATTKKFIPFIW